MPRGLKMDAKTLAKFEARAEILKAMAHATRLYILDVLLKEDEVCVGDFTAQIGADASTVSKHLSVLKSAGLISDIKRGNQVFYRLSTPCVLRFFDCAEAVIKKRTAEQIKVAQSINE